MASIIRTLRCTRCKTVREDEYSMRGALVARRYFYPDDYKIEGYKPEDAPKLRLANLQRHLG